jgi:hypothetical protein
MDLRWRGGTSAKIERDVQNEFRFQAGCVGPTAARYASPVALTSTPS